MLICQSCFDNIIYKKIHIEEYKNTKVQKNTKRKEENSCTPDQSHSILERIVTLNLVATGMNLLLSFSAGQRSVKAVEPVDGDDVHAK